MGASVTPCRTDIPKHFIPKVQDYTVFFYQWWWPSPTDIDKRHIHTQTLIKGTDYLCFSFSDKWQKRETSTTTHARCN